MNWRRMPTILGVNFGGAQYSLSKVAEKFTANFPKIRQAQIKNSPQIRSAEPRAQKLELI